MSTTLSIDSKITELSKVSDELLNQLIQILISNYESRTISKLIVDHRNCFVIVSSELETDFLYLESYEGGARIRLEGHNYEEIFFQTIFNLSEEHLNIFPEEMLDELSLV